MLWRKARRNSFDPDVLLDRDDQGPSADFMESLKERVGSVIVIIIVIYNNKSWTWAMGNYFADYVCKSGVST